MKNEFNLNAVNNYMNLRNRMIDKVGGYVLKFNEAAVMCLFDKNADGVVSQKEFNSVSEADYNKYLNGLNRYNRIEKNELCDITYQKMNEYMDDKVITESEIRGLDNKFGLKNKNIPETRKLGNYYTYSDEKIQEETLHYDSSAKYFSRYNLLELHKDIALYDQNSDTLDFHIGSFAQGRNNMCSLLAVIDTLSDEELKEMYQVKTNEKGEQYYEVTFPADVGKQDKKIIVTQEELDCACATIENQNLSGLPKGDRDVTLLSIAYLKRNGNKIFFKGGELNVVRNVFKKTEDAFFIDNYNLENFDFSKLTAHSSFRLLYDSEKKAKNNLRPNIKLTDGRIVEDMGPLEISDGTIINRRHAYSVRGYDTKTKELILSNYDNTNTSEIRVPVELAPYFCIPTQVEPKKEE